MILEREHALFFINRVYLHSSMIVSLSLSGGGDDGAGIAMGANFYSFSGHFTHRFKNDTVGDNLK